MDTKLIEKIQKLLSLSESSNENEAREAMLKAQKLIVKHKLSLKEVQDTKIYSSKIKDDISKISFTKAKWKGELAYIIGKNFGCYTYFRTNRIHKITFFGREEDIVVCNIVLDYAVDCIETTIKRIQSEYRRKGLSTKGLATDYAKGFIEGLDEKFEEQKRANQEWGLVLVVEKEVTEAYNKKKFKRAINLDTQFKGNLDAYKKGIENGKQFSISNRITESDNEEVLKLQA